MPFTRLALILCYVIVAAGLTIFLFAQMQAPGQGTGQGSGVGVILPLAMLAGLGIRALHKRLDRDDDRG